MLSSEQQVHALKHEIYQREKYIESQQAENSALREALYKQQRICGWLKTNGYKDAVLAAEVTIELER